MNWLVYSKFKIYWHGKTKLCTYIPTYTHICTHIHALNRNIQCIQKYFATVMALMPFCGQSSPVQLDALLSWQNYWWLFMTDDQIIFVYFYNAIQCKGWAQCKIQTQSNRIQKWLTIAPGDWDTLKEHQEEQTHPAGWVIVEEFKHIQAALTQEKHKCVI